MSTHRKPGPARTASAPGAEKLLEQFSSDRTIAEYAAEIWDAKPCPVP
jgi:glucan phosphorylase